jgi:hypothetical protein
MLRKHDGSVQAERIPWPFANLEPERIIRTRAALFFLQGARFLSGISMTTVLTVRNALPRAGL